MRERKKRFSRDISCKEGTIGNVLKTHAAELEAERTAEGLRTLVAKLFKENGIDTEKSRLVLVKLGAMSSWQQAAKYVYDVMLASMGLGVYS